MSSGELQDGASHGRSGEEFRVPEYQELVLMNEDFNNRRRNKLGDNPIINTAQDPDIQQDINRLLSTQALFNPTPSESNVGRSRRQNLGSTGVNHTNVNGNGSKRKETDEQQDEEFNPNKKKTKTAKKIQKRITNACDACKHGHLKCDGTTPCNNCRAHNKKCLYSLNKKRGPKKRDDKLKQSDGDNSINSSHGSNSSNSNHTSPPLEFSYDNECTHPNLSSASKNTSATNCYADSSKALAIQNHTPSSSSSSPGATGDHEGGGKAGQVRH